MGWFEDVVPESVGGVDGVSEGVDCIVVFLYWFVFSALGGFGVPSVAGDFFDEVGASVGDAEFVGAEE